MANVTRARTAARTAHTLPPPSPENVSLGFLSTVYKERRGKRNRQLVVDSSTELTEDHIQAGLSDYSDLIRQKCFPPRTKKALAWKTRMSRPRTAARTAHTLSPENVPPRMLGFVEEESTITKEHRGKRKRQLDLVVDSSTELTAEHIQAGLNDYSDLPAQRRHWLGRPVSSSFKSPLAAESGTTPLIF